jgi:hypothetical protein
VNFKGAVIIISSIAIPQTERPNWPGVAKLAVEAYEESQDTILCKGMKMDLEDTRICTKTATFFLKIAST